jgi:hypothetical protein
MAHEFSEPGMTKTARWRQLFQVYDSTSEHRLGRKHNNADALSERPCQVLRTHCHKVETRANVKQVRANAALPTAGSDSGPLRTEQLNHPDIWPFLQEVETGRTTGVERHR